MKEMCCEFKLKSTHGLLLAVPQHTSKCQDKGLIFTFWPLLMLRCMSYSCHSLLRHHLPHLFLSIPTFPTKKKLFPYLSQPFSVMHEQVMGCFHLHESFISRFTAQLHLLTLSPTLNTQNAFPPQEDYALNLPGVSNKSDK